MTGFTETEVVDNPILDYYAEEVEHEMKACDCDDCDPCDYERAS